MTTIQTPAAGWYPDPSGEPGMRYFDGGAWTQYTREMQPLAIPLSLEERSPLSLGERSDLLDIVVARGVHRGWRVESRSPTQAVLVHGQPQSGGVHVVHFLLTLLTFGLWSLVWILYGMSRYEERFTFTVDPYGTIIEN